MFVIAADAGLKPVYFRVMAALKNWICTAAIAIAVCTNSLGGALPQSAEIPSETAFHAVHNALFASFLPVDELPDDPHAEALLRTARDAIWQQMSNVAAVQQLLAPFADLHRFGPACGVANAIEGAGVRSFAELSVGKRQQVLMLLQNCSDGPPRRLAATVRNFYIVKGYGSVQGELTGIKLKLFAPPEYLKSHTPHLPPTRLTYNSSKKELTEKDGQPIDVLIVGSGPAGSVLAHELRRNGKRVVLLERGSFVVPGSMETRLIDDLIDTRTSMDGAIRD